MASDILDQKAAQRTLTGDWGDLSPLLIAEFFPCKRTTDSFTDWGRDPEAVSVRAPLVDSNLELGLGWKSEFEGGADQKAPTLFAMLQSGQLQPVVDAVVGGKVSEVTNSGLSQFLNRTGMTKLNSMQVFTGMEPVKITATLVFRAWSDAKSEVEAPLNQLMSWALPEELSNDSVLMARAVEAMKGSKEWVEAMMPSKAPTIIGMTYKGRTYKPLVIESVSLPLDSPINKRGDFVSIRAQISMQTLAAIDQKDWKSYKL